MENDCDENVEKRLAALKEYDIMDTPTEQGFDDLTHLASFICGTPISIITMLDGKRQWFKSKIGLLATETPIEHAFCAHAILKPGVFTVQDATTDLRFCQNPLVTADPFIKFYAGVPLISPEGVPLGTICVIDTVSRVLTQDQKKALAGLSRQVISQLELRRMVRSLSNTLAVKEAAINEIKQLQAMIPICMYCKKIRDDKNYWHQVDEYMQTRLDIGLSHGICPQCYDIEMEKFHRGE